MKVELPTMSVVFSGPFHDIPLQRGVHTCRRTVKLTKTRHSKVSKLSPSHDYITCWYRHNLSSHNITTRSTNLEKIRVFLPKRVRRQHLHDSELFHCKLTLWPISLCEEQAQCEIKMIPHQIHCTLSPFWPISPCMPQKVRHKMYRLRYLMWQKQLSTERDESDILHTESPNTLRTWQQASHRWHHVTSHAMATRTKIATVTEKSGSYERSFSLKDLHQIYNVGR